MESQKKHRRKLTAKQRALVRALAKTRHLGKAAIEAGYSSKNATQSAAQALASIRKTAPGLLAKHGLDDDSLIEKHLIPLLQAQETKYFAYTRKGKRLLLERTVPAHSIRANALDMALKIRGLYVREAENKVPEFSVIIIDSAHRPHGGGDATRAAENRSSGFERVCKRRRMKIEGTRSLICRAGFTSAFKLFKAAWIICASR